MAKQQVSTGGGLISASANLSSVMISVDVAGEFMKTFGADTKQYEAEQNAAMAEMKSWMNQLKTDIDFTQLSPEMEGEVRRFLSEERTEYASLANTVSKIKDPTAKEYQQAVDRMNEIQREFATLSKELTSYNQEKRNMAINVKNGGVYSNYNPNLALHKDIYGLSEKGHAKMSIDRGHVTFNVNGETVKYNSLEGLSPRSNGAAQIVKKAEYYEARGVEMTDANIANAKKELTDGFTNDNFFLTTIFDGTEDFNLIEIKEEVIKAQKAGNLSEVIGDLKTRAVNLIVNGYQDAAISGKTMADMERERAAAAVASNDKTAPDVYNNTERQMLARLGTMAGNPTRNFTLGAGYGNDRYVWSAGLGSFVLVDSDGEVIFDSETNQPFREVPLSEYIKMHPELKEKDIKEALRVK